MALGYGRYGERSPHIVIAVPSNWLAQITALWPSGPDFDPVHENLTTTQTSP